MQLLILGVICAAIGYWLRGSELASKEKDAELSNQILDLVTKKLKETGEETVTLSKEELATLF